MTRKATLIAPPSGWGMPSLRELWIYRELLLILTLRDIQVRYKQTAVGITWAAIQPLMTMVVFSVVFGKLASIPSDGLPYPLFSMAALLPWQLFAKAMTQASGSLVTMQSLLTKVYFPRIFAPLSSIGSGLIDAAIALVILLGMMAWYGVYPGWQIFALPLFVIMAMLTALAVALWLSALNVQYRDIQHALPFLAQFWMFATPIVYPASMVPEQWRLLYLLNPMATVIEGFRFSLLGSNLSLDPLAVTLSGLLLLLFTYTGLLYFNRVEKNFVDRV